MKYCLHCDWTVTRADRSDVSARSRVAVDHFVETGHTIGSLPEPPAPEPALDPERATRIPVTGVREEE